MNKNGCIIRLERKEEERATQNLVRECFWNVYRPGCLEHYVLHIARKSPKFISFLNFVLELECKLIGKIIFVEAEICVDDRSTLPIATIGPICILPNLYLVEEGKAEELDKQFQFKEKLWKEGQIF